MQMGPPSIQPVSVWASSKTSFSFPRVSHLGNRATRKTRLYVHTNVYTYVQAELSFHFKSYIDKKLSDTQWRSFEILPSSRNQLFFSVNLFVGSYFIVQTYTDVYVRACKIEELSVHSFLLFFSVSPHLFFCPPSFWHFKFSDIYICFLLHFFLSFLSFFLWTCSASHSKLTLSFNVPQTTPRIANEIHWSVRLRLPACLRARRSGLKRLLASPGMPLHAPIHSLTRSFYSPCLSLFLCETRPMGN